MLVSESECGFRMLWEQLKQKNQDPSDYGKVVSKAMLNNKSEAKEFPILMKGSVLEKV